MDTTKTTCDPARAERSEDKPYFLCNDCGAKFFGPEGTAECPRCESDNLQGGEPQLVPWNVPKY